MNRKGEIIIIEDDEDDQSFFEAAFKNLKYENKLCFFGNGQEALDFLNASLELTPFLILSDINMPKLDGFALRDKVRMDANLQLRCIPYIYFSTSVSQNEVIKAYSLSAQGFFQKQVSMEELEKSISVIMEYWARCASPNNFIE